ncbi:hypothetical protein QBC38DRAFT_376618, partial [Podospora fimiseda]
GGVQFQLSIIKLLKQWEERWIMTLKKIDSALELSLKLSLKKSNVEKFMFDDSFDPSKSYFIVLHILRTASDMVNEALADRKELHNAWQSVFALRYGIEFCAEDLKAIDYNWNVVFDLITALTNRIQGQIDRNTKEVKSLRDGMFNTTSLKEATNGLTLNKAVYIFTTVTVFCTPISFLATFWALPCFEKDPEDSKSAEKTPKPKELPGGFTETFVLTPLATYIPCIIIGWFLLSKKQRQRYKGSQKRAVLWLLTQNLDMYQWCRSHMTCLGKSRPDTDKASITSGSALV